MNVYFTVVWVVFGIGEEIEEIKTAETQRALR